MLSFYTPSWAGQFFETLYDVPVLLDLEEISDEAMVFDKPSGRIAKARAISASGQKAILGAYEAALVQMGWEDISEGQFKRDSEILSISIVKSGTSPDSMMLVEFSLKPVAE